MNTVRVDTKGLRCPQPVLRLALASAEISKGTLVEVIGDCSTFEKDIRIFCERKRLPVLSVRAEEGATAIQIQF